MESRSWYEQEKAMNRIMEESKHRPKIIKRRDGRLYNLPGFA